MQKFKPTKDEWETIKEVARRGAYPPLRTINHVRLECRQNYNVDDGSKPLHINMALVTNDPSGYCNDCDLNDSGPEYTTDFKNGTDLAEGGLGIFDFYIYDRYLRDDDLRGNVLVAVVNGKMTKVWIEGGEDFSWTPESGIAAKRLRRSQ